MCDQQGIREVHAKQALRIQAGAARRALQNRRDMSRRIVARFLALPAYQSAQTVLYYVDVRAEVQTRHALPGALAGSTRIVVPWCNEHGELELFHLGAMHELDIGRYGIFEPRTELRTRREKRVDPRELDVLMVPGVAFDRRGGRIGHGKGYYDKLLAQARTDATLVGLAFTCQMFDEVPMQPHDVFMDMVVTETAVYDGIGRRSVSPHM